jgi:ABC-2 type transport system permease protein
MAVYRRGYQRYQGPICGRWHRFMVLPRFAWKRLFQQRLVNLLLIVALIWPLLCAIFIYIGNHADILKSFGPIQSFFTVQGYFFLIFMDVQAVFAVFLAALIGPGLIVPDLANNALPLYFSRPLHRTDYMLARIITLLGMLSLITWLPGLVLFGLQTGMAGRSWFRENWTIGTSIFAGFALWALLASMVALASSAYAKLKVVAGGIVLGFFFLLSGISVMVNGVFGATWGHALNPFWAANRLWYSMLNAKVPTGVKEPQGPDASACLCVLIAMILLLVLVLARKLRPVEVVS